MYNEVKGMLFWVNIGEQPKGRYRMPNEVKCLPYVNFEALIKTHSVSGQRIVVDLDKRRAFSMGFQNEQNCHEDNAE
jgi:hypothetical protein